MTRSIGLEASRSFARGVLFVWLLSALPAAGQEAALDGLLATKDPDPVELALAVAGIVEPDLEPGPVREALAAAALGLAKVLAGAPDDTARIAALRAAVHETLALEVEGHPERQLATPSFFPHRVLGARRGACLGLSLVYMSLGKRAGLAVSGVSAPGHFFVRFHGTAGPVNLETTLGGLPQEEDWFRGRTGIPKGEERIGNYLRDLTPPEVAAEVLNNTAGALVREGEPARALPLLRLACRLAPEDPDAYYNLAVALGKTGAAAAAREAVDRSLALFRSQGASNLRGLMHLEHGAAGPAERDFTRALALDPAAAHYRTNRALARLLGSDAAGAAADLAAIEEPGFAWRAFFGRASQGAAVAESLRAVAGLLEGKRKLAVAALFAAGDRFLDAGRATQAKAAFARVLRLDGENVEAYCKRGKACEALGDELWAKRNYYLASQADPRDPLSYRYFAEYYMNRERYAVALEYFRKWLARAPQDAPERPQVEALVAQIEDALGG